MNPIVIYKSMYGAAKQYAEHIAKSLGCKALPLDDVKNTALDAYDTVIFGGGVYVSKINGSKFIVKEFDKLKDKKLAVFAVTLSPTDNQQILQSYIDASFPSEMRDKIKFFHFRGGMDISKLSFLHRPMIRMLNKMLKKKPPSERTDSESSMLSMISGIVDGKPANFFDATTTAPLIEFIKN